MREAGLVAAEILDEVCAAAKPGVSTWELDQIARAAIDKHKVTSAFLGYSDEPPYRGAVHLASTRSSSTASRARTTSSKDGDIIGIDFGIFKHGFCADTARTVLRRQRVRDKHRKLVETAGQALERGDRAVPSRAAGSATSATRSRAMRNHDGYSVVRQFVGHGTGRQMHEDPQVPNFGGAGRAESG